VKALVIIAVLVLGGFTTLRLMVFSLDTKGLESEIAASAPAVTSGRTCLSAKLYADNVARFAANNGFTVATEQVHVERKAVRTGVLDLTGPVTVKGKGPEPLHDYEVTVTVSRSLFPLWSKRVTLKVPTMAPCAGDHQGDGAESYP
jgi:hypothetical protein